MYLLALWLSGIPPPPLNLFFFFLKKKKFPLFFFFLIKIKWFVLVLKRKKESKKKRKKKFFLQINLGQHKTTYILIYFIFFVKNKTAGSLNTPRKRERERDRKLQFMSPNKAGLTRTKSGSDFQQPSLPYIYIYISISYFTSLRVE